MDAELSYPEKRNEIVDAIELLFRAGVMSHSGHANFSSRVGDDRLLVTTGAVVRDLQPKALVTAGMNGHVEDGSPEAGTDGVLDMHLTVYHARPDTQAVVHTHSPALTAFALANRPLPCRYETLLRFAGQIGEVPVTPWTPGRRDPEFLQGITDAICGQPTTRAVLLANHGVLGFAASPFAAAMLIIALEEAAQAELSAAMIGGARDLPGEGLPR